MDDFWIFSGYIILLCNLILYGFTFFCKGKGNLFFTSYLLFSFVMQCSLELLYRLSIPSLILMNIFFIGQMILLGLFYRSLCINKKQKKVILSILIFSLIAIVFQISCDFTQLFKFNLFEITLTSLVVILFAVLHLYNLLSENRSYYYFTIGLIFYLFAGTIVYLTADIINSMSENFKYISWTLNAFLVFIYYLFILHEWKVSFSKKTLLQK